MMGQHDIDRRGAQRVTPLPPHATSAPHRAGLQPSRHKSISLTEEMAALGACRFRASGPMRQLVERRVPVQSPATTSRHTMISFRLFDACRQPPITPKR